MLENYPFTNFDRDLKDPFREIHGHNKKNTWKRLNPVQQGRLDFF